MKPKESVLKLVKKLAHEIKNDAYKSVSLLTGAGVSVACGIPDFRSPGGMYDTLRPDFLTATESQRQNMRVDPTTVVSWKLFQENQFPYMEVRRPFILGTSARQWKMSLSHYFARALYERGILNTLYTQNIDGLDFQTGVPEDKIVSVHGTIARAECEFCSTAQDQATFIDSVRCNIKDIYGLDPNAPRNSSPILCLHCQKPGVKPATVLYGRSLPSKFFKSCEEHLPACDLLLVMGTSLTVHPAAGVPDHPLLPVSAKRVLINLEPAGSLDFLNQPGSRDAFLRGDCDDILLHLMDELGWLEDVPVESLCASSKELVLDFLRQKTFSEVVKEAAGLRGGA